MIGDYRSDYKSRGGFTTKNTKEEKREMQNAKCKVQNGKWESNTGSHQLIAAFLLPFCILHFAFCIYFEVVPYTCA
jgi:hypothetical protein